MPGPLTEQEREAFFAEPHVAVLSVSTGDASPPHATPVWYHYAPGGDVTFFTGTQGRTARKAALIERAGAVSLTVQRAEFPYRYATVQGSVVGADRPPDAERLRAIVRRYLPEEVAPAFVRAELEHPSPGFVLYTVRPERWLTFDFGDDEA